MAVSTEKKKSRKKTAQKTAKAQETLEKAKQTGTVTYDELEEILPEDASAEEIDEVTEENRSLAGTSYAEVAHTIEMLTGPPPATSTTTYDAYGQLGGSELVGRRLREAL